MGIVNVSIVIKRSSYTHAVSITMKQDPLDWQTLLAETDTVTNDCVAQTGHVLINFFVNWIERFTGTNPFVSFDSLFLPSLFVYVHEFRPFQEAILVNGLSYGYGQCLRYGVFSNDGKSYCCLSGLNTVLFVISFSVCLVQIAFSVLLQS